MNRKRIFQILGLSLLGAIAYSIHSVWTHPYKPTHHLGAKLVKPTGTGAREGTLLSMSQ